MSEQKTSGFQPTRRQFMASTAALGAAALMPSIATAAPSGDLVVSNWGGDWNNNVVKGFEAPAFGSSRLNIIHDLAPAAERKTKLLAERRLPRSSVDVTWLTDADAFEMNSQSVLEEIDTSLIPNSSHVLDKLRTPYMVPAIYGGLVILYNPEKIPQPPKSFAELWNPAYAGRVGVIDALHFNYIYAAALSHGGSMGDVSKAFPALLEMKKAVQPRLYPSHQALAAGFQSGEIWISANYSARAIQWGKDGLPIKWSYPDEGAVFIAFGAAITKRARNREAAYAYLNAMLEPAHMGAISESTSYTVSTDNAALSPESRQLLEFTPEQVNKLHIVDYAYAAKSDPQWLDWWNKEFKG